MLAEQKRQFTSMSEEQQEADPVGEISSIDKVNVCVATNVKSYKIMFKKDEPAAEKRGGDFEIRSETRFDNFYDLNLF